MYAEKKKDFRKNKKFYKARNVVIARDAPGGVGECHICGLELRVRNDFELMGLQLEVDHIIAPEGDEKLYYDVENMSLTHKFCNGRKSNKVLTRNLRISITRAMVKFLKSEDFSIVDSKIVKKGDDSLIRALEKVSVLESKPRMTEISSGILW